MTNRIRYPKPNRLGLIKPKPYIETIMGRVTEVKVPVK
jgi:hypothetical protein